MSKPKQEEKTVFSFAKEASEMRKKLSEKLYVPCPACKVKMKRTFSDFGHYTCNKCRCIWTLVHAHK